jgi:type I restriction enzyme M protein
LGTNKWPSRKARSIQVCGQVATACAEAKIEKETGWDGKLVPKALIIEKFFGEEQKLINDAETVIAAAQAEIDDIIENMTEEDDDDDIEKELKKRKKGIAEKNKLLKDLKTALDRKTREQYRKLTDAQCLDLLLERKWHRTLNNGIFALYEAVSHRIADRVNELGERYEKTLPELEAEVERLRKKVRGHLGKMGVA